MRKLLIGVVVTLIACGVGYFGLQFYVQGRITAQVDAALAQMRANGATATRGTLAFDLFTRTLTISDLAVKSDAQPPVDVKIGRFTAAGVDIMQTGRFAANRIEIAEIDAAGTIAMQGGLKVGYKAPRIEIAAYSGPAAPLRAFDPTSPIDLWRFALEHFAAMSADTITIPSINASMAPADPAAANGLGPAEYTYSDIAVRGVRQGKIASATIERVSYKTTVAMPGGKEPLAGEITKVAVLDVDATATLAMLDPARAKDDSYYRAYRQVTAGPYTVSIGTGIKVAIDAMTADDLGLRPSRLQIADILAMINTMPAPGTQPSPAQAQQMMQKIAGIYEGLSIGGFEMRGLSVTTPDGTVKLDAVRLAKMENGRIGEFAIEGLDSAVAGSPVKVGRFALKAFDIAGVMRLATQFSPGGQPTPEQAVAILHLIEGAELKGLVSSEKTGKPVNIESASISWGDYVGPLPSRLRASLKMSGPLNTDDPDPFNMLAAAGFSSATVSVDLGAAWNEGARTVALEPGTVELEKFGTLSTHLAVGNVPREIFTVDPFELMIAAALVEAGPVELVVHDTGGIDLALTRYARTQNITREAATKAVTDSIRQNAAVLVALNPDAMAIAGAIARFIETPGGTLTIKLTPKGSVPLAQLIEAGKDNPFDALTRFQVEAVAGK